MKRNILTKISGAILVLAIALITGCAKLTNGETGLLEGVILIGPLCPVETVPPDPACQPTAETYKAYPLGVYSSDGTKKIASILSNLDGSYITELYPGTYKVVLEKEQQGPGSSNLPADITISSNDVTVLNINIDTGIR
jgi:hypothetical protein